MLISLFVFACALVSSHQAAVRLDNSYYNNRNSQKYQAQQPLYQTSTTRYSTNRFASNSYTEEYQPQRNLAAPATTRHNYAQQEHDAHAQTLRNEQDINPDGTYHYAYETSNGISASEHGTAGVSVQGTNSYISPEGIEIKTTYVADENGYHAVGDHIPKTPDYILRALEYIKNHPYQERDYYSGATKQADIAPKVRVYTHNAAANIQPTYRPSYTRHTTRAPVYTTSAPANYYRGRARATNNYYNKFQ